MENIAEVDAELVRVDAEQPVLTTVPCSQRTGSARGPPLPRRLATCYGVDEKAIQAAEAADLVRGHACGTRSVQVWQGEEDCDWLTLVCASPAVHAAWVESSRRPGVLPPKYPFEAWAREHAALERLQEQLRFWRPTYPQGIRRLTHTGTGWRGARPGTAGPPR